MGGDSPHRPGSVALGPPFSAPGGAETRRYVEAKIPANEDKLRHKGQGTPAERGCRRAPGMTVCARATGSDRPPGGFSVRTGACRARARGLRVLSLGTEPADHLRDPHGAARSERRGARLGPPVRGAQDPGELQPGAALARARGWAGPGGVAADRSAPADPRPGAAEP